MVGRIAVLLAALLMSAAVSAAAAQRFIPLLQPGDAVPPIPLIAQDGRAFSLAELRGNAVAVAFIYTRCGDTRMCPLVSAKFARAQRAVGTAPIRLLILTLDPEFDTPAVLARYGRAFGQDARRWTLATGAPGSIAEFAGRFGIASSQPRPGSIVHTEALAIVGPDGRLATTIDGNEWSVADLITAARATLPGSSEPLSGLPAWLSSAMERCGAAVPGLNGGGMLTLLGIALGAVGTAFWFAFRAPARPHLP
jgi:cytochrome oxidase Cu insertion factor (SCO1/SenC/PrrC family)